MTLYDPIRTIWLLSIEVLFKGKNIFHLVPRFLMPSTISEFYYTQKMYGFLWLYIDPKTSGGKSELVDLYWKGRRGGGDTIVVNIAVHMFLCYIVHIDCTGSLVTSHSSKTSQTFGTTAVQWVRLKFWLWQWCWGVVTTIHLLLTLHTSVFMVRQKEKKSKI